MNSKVNINSQSLQKEIAGMQDTNKNLVLQTVRLISDVDKSIDVVNPATVQFLKSCRVPNLTAADFQAFEKNLEDGKPAVDSLCDISAKVEFRREKLDEFLKLAPSFANERGEVFLPFLFAYSIQFLFNLPSEQLNYDLELLLRCFHVVITSTIDEKYLENIDCIVMLISRRTMHAALAPFHDSLVSILCTHVKYFHLKDPMVIPFLVLMLEMCCQTDNKEQKRTILTTVKELIMNCDCFALVDGYLLPFLETQLPSLDRICYEIIGRVGSLHTSDNLGRLYSGLPDVIWHFVTENRSIFEKMPTQEPKEELPFAKFINKASGDEAPVGPLEEEYDKITDIQLDVGNFKIEDFYPEGMMPMTDTVLVAFADVKLDLLATFLDCFARLVLKYDDKDLLLVFVYFLSKIKQIKVVDSWALDVLTSHYFFAPSVTIFNTKLTTHTNFFRATAISIICFYGQYLIPGLLEKFVVFPYLFPEILMRVEKCFPGFLDISIMFDDAVFQNMMKCEAALNVICSQVAYEAKLIALSARLKIFAFAFALFGLKEVPANCYQSPFFTTSFISAFSEPGLKHVMFAQLQNVLAKETTSKQTVQFLVDSVKKNANQPANQAIAANLLQCLGECLHLNKILLGEAPGLFKSSLESPKSDIVFQAQLRFGVQLIHHSPDFRLDFHDIAHIASYMNSKSDLDDVSIAHLVGLMSNSPSTGFGAMFLINQPIVAVALMSVFSCHGRTKELLGYAKQLAEFSLYNPVKFHEGQFDILLLDMMCHSPHPFMFRGCKIVTGDSSLLGEIYSVFDVISQVKSSQIVATRLLGVMAPKRKEGVDCGISDKGIPDVSAFEIDEEKSSLVFSQLASRFASDQDRKTWFCCATEQIVCDKMISFGKLTGNVCISGSIYVDEQLALLLNLKCTILRMEDDVGLILEVFLKGCSLLLSACNEETLITLVLIDEVPMGHVKFAIEIDAVCQGKLGIRAHVNGKYPQSGEMKILTLDPETMLKMIVGQTLPAESQDMRTRMDLAFQLKDLVILDRCFTAAEWQDVCSSCRIYDDAFWRMPANSCSPRLQNLLDVFKHQVSPQVALPMFLFLDKYEVSQRELIIDLMIMMFGEHLVRHSAAISKAIMTNSAETFRFGLYQKLAGLIDVCSTTDEYYDLFDNILCNIDIWKQSPQLEKILSHWYHMMYELFPKYFLQDMFFDKMMYTLSQIPDKGPATSVIMNLVSRRIGDSSALAECEKILEALANGNGVMKILDIVGSLEVEFREETANLIVSIPFCTNAEDVIRIVHCLRKCQNWSAYYPGFVYHLPSTVDETILEAHYEEIPDIVFCVFWIKLLKKQRIEDKVLQLFGKQLGSASSLFVLMLVLEQRRNPTRTTDVCVILSSYLDRKSDRELLTSVLHIIDVFGSHDLACALCKMRYEAMVLSSGKASVNEMIVGCYRALFVRRRQYYHQEELNGSPNTELPTDWDTVHDLLKFTKHEAVYTVCPKEHRVFSPHERALFEFSVCLLKDTHPTQPLLVYIVNHLDYKKEKKASFFDFNFVDQILSPIIGESHNTIDKIRVFLESVCAFVDRESIVQSFEYEKEIFRMADRAAKQWRHVLLDFMHKETIWGLTDFTYVRDYHFSDHFGSLNLKRSTMYTRKRFDPPLKEEVKGPSCQLECLWIKTTSTLKCTLFGYNGYLQILKRNEMKTINHSRILHVLFRDRNGETTCLEFFFTNGYSILLDFAPVKALAVVRALKIPKTKNSIFQGKSYQDLIASSQILDQYVERKLSVTDFLLWLNMLSGRSYHDITNYPIFPCIDTQSDSVLAFATPPSPKILSYLLARQEPFTTLHQHLSAKNERQFTSINDMVRNFELCPEFFTMPETFMNLNKTTYSIPSLDLCGEFKDVFEFVYEQRKLLEQIDISSWLESEFGFTATGSRRSSDTTYHELLSLETSSDQLPELAARPAKVIPLPIPSRRQLVIASSSVKSYTVQASLDTAFVIGSNVFFLNKDKSLFMFKDGKIEDLKVEVMQFLCANSKQALLVRSDDQLVTVSENGKQRELKQPSSSISYDMISLEETDTLTLAFRNGHIEFYSLKEMQSPLELPIDLLSDSIACVHVSQSFGVLIYATYGGVIAVMSLAKRRFVNSYHAGVIADHILVSRNSGNILVLTKRRIIVLTINGFLVKTYDVDFDICQICQYEVDGIDYSCVSDDFGHLSKFETFYPERIQTMCYCGNKRLLALHRDGPHIIAVSTNGSVYIINP